MNLLQLAFDWLDGKASPQPAPQAAPPSPSELPGKTAGQRHIVLKGQSITYQFERSKRRTIGFMVGKEGLTVRAPRWTPLHEVELAITEKAHWILKQLHAAHERHTRAAQHAPQWHDGGTIHYLGETFTLRLGAMATFIDESEKIIWVGLARLASPDQIQDAVQAAISRSALLLFESRLNHYAPQLGVTWSRLKLSNAGGRWGSAKSDGTIRLNWRLMHYRLPVIDYVVVHELSHLRHMDHSPRFWDTVGSIMPDYAKLKKELRP